MGARNHDKNGFETIDIAHNGDGERSVDGGILYDPNSNHQMFRGRAEIDVTLQDVKNPDNEQEHFPFSGIYPRDITGALPCDSTSLSAFATDFYEDVAVRLAWLFTKHPTQDDHRIGSDVKFQ